MAQEKLSVPRRVYEKIIFFLVRKDRTIKEKINMWKLVSSEEILELSLLVSLTSRRVSDLKTCSKDDLLVRIMWTTDFQMKNWGKLVPIKWYENIQVKIPRFGACEILQQMCQPTLNSKRNQLHFGWLPGQPVTFLWTISSIFYRSAMIP